MTDHFEQAASGVMVFLVHFQMLGEVVDSAGQNSNLNLGGTGVTFVGGVGFDNGLFFFFEKHVFFHLF